VKDEATREVLVKARELVEKGWTKGAMARNKYRHRVQFDSLCAVKFCAIGAISRSAKDRPSDQEKLDISARKAIRKINELDSISVFNDSDDTTKADVLAAFDKAIAYASEQ